MGDAVTDLYGSGFDWSDQAGDRQKRIRKQAEDFLTLYHRENADAGPLDRRLAEVTTEIEQAGTYWQNPQELAFGAKVAWRNSSRCIGRLYWRSLTVRDKRHLWRAEDVYRESVEHLNIATNDGRIRPVITIFAPDTPERRGPHVWNNQLLGYAGYDRPDEPILGDPRNRWITEEARKLGWPGVLGTKFDLLPLIVQEGTDKPRWFELPNSSVLEVEIAHPDVQAVADLDLRWYAVPAISNMRMDIGGVSYRLAPFNGWYMGTEIGARNLADADRYNLLPQVARCFNLDTSQDRSLWKDRALVELNLAILYSFERAGVTITDHHTESRRFLTHIAREERAGRQVGADWSWIVPPISGSVTGVFHRYYDTVEQEPAFIHDTEEKDLVTGDTCDIEPLSQLRHQRASKSAETHATSQLRNSCCIRPQGVKNDTEDQQSHNGVDQIIRREPEGAPHAGSGAQIASKSYLGRPARSDKD